MARKKKKKKRKKKKKKRRDVYNILHRKKGILKDVVDTDYCQNLQCFLSNKAMCSLLSYFRFCDEFIRTGDTWVGVWAGEEEIELGRDKDKAGGTDIGEHWEHPQVVDEQVETVGDDKGGVEIYDDSRSLLLLLYALLIVGDGYEVVGENDKQEDKSRRDVGILCILACVRVCKRRCQRSNVLWSMYNRWSIILRKYRSAVLISVTGNPAILAHAELRYVLSWTNLDATTRLAKNMRLPQLM